MKFRPNGNISPCTILGTCFFLPIAGKVGNDSYLSGSNIRVLATTVDTKNNDHVELVPVKAKAGYNDPAFISQLPMFNIPGLRSDRKYRLFPITGDSMLPVPENSTIITTYAED